MAIRKPDPVIEDAASVTETVTPFLAETCTAQSSVALSIASTITPDPEYDIEHMPVQNDPRAWSPLRKNLSLMLISTASMVATLAANIQNPAVEAMEEDLPATPSQFSLSISLFILTQGLFPLVWSAISEVKGRKLVYILSLALFTLGSMSVALSTHIGPVIAFRCLQAVGSSAVTAIGAATLADIFDPAERGSKMGVYYVAPLLGPAVGPVFGGILTSIWGWRAIFWFLAFIAGVTLVAFVAFFRDTFRCERSLIYQKVVKTHIHAASLAAETLKQETITPIAGKDRVDANGSEIDIEKITEKFTTEDVRKKADRPIVELTIKHVNFLGLFFQVLQRPNNFLILLSSGLLYAYGFVVIYAISRTLSSTYGLSALKIGLVTIAYGAGSVGGSVIGGRCSDYQLAKLKAASGDKGCAEMRLSSTFVGMVFLPPSVVALGWVCQQHLPVPVICVFLFLGGFSWIWIYSSSLAYIVDANLGRSSTAVAGNSAFRGIFAFIATETTVPLQDNLGDGWMFVVWAAVVGLGCACILLVRFKGEQWRVEAELREVEHMRHADTTTFSTMTLKA